jgi:flagellum-specific ATP synthase
LVGERGRELNEFVQNDLGKEGLQRSVVIVATSDQSPVQKISAAMIATRVAEYFRDQGKHVNLMMDSITRYAHAVRELGSATREPVTVMGYPSSLNQRLSRLVERAGTSKSGTITGFYTVLVDADDMENPVADAVRGFLDGHIVMSRDLAALNHYPAIDVLESISRVMVNVVDEDSLRYANWLRKYLAIYRENEDFIRAGAYASGSDPEVDKSIHVHKIAQAFLQQNVGEESTLEQTKAGLREMYVMLEGAEEVRETFI